MKMQSCELDNSRGCIKYNIIDKDIPEEEVS